MPRPGRNCSPDTTFDRIVATNKFWERRKPSTRAGRMLAKAGMLNAAYNVIYIVKAVGLRRMLSFPLRRGLPDFFIIGAAKCGTTTLFDIVTSHPGVCDASAMKEKEPWYFGISPLSLRWYRCFFPIRKNGRLACDASTSSLPSSLAPAQIRCVLPDVKFIAILRDPVDRALSHYEYAKRRGDDVPASFEDALKAEYGRIAERGVQTVTKEFHEYLVWGHYAAQLERWFSVFDRGQFLILTTAELKKDRQGAADKVFDFLGLPKHDVADVKDSNTNKYADMLPETRRTLSEYYRPHNERLYKLLGRKFDWS